jgi:hypothetical protein
MSAPPDKRKPPAVGVGAGTWELTDLAIGCEAQLSTRRAFSA